LKIWEGCSETNCLETILSLTRNNARAWFPEAKSIDSAANYAHVSQEIRIGTAIRATSLFCRGRLEVLSIGSPRNPAKPIRVALRRGRHCTITGDQAAQQSDMQFTRLCCVRSDDNVKFNRRHLCWNGSEYCTGRRLIILTHENKCTTALGIAAFCWIQTYFPGTAVTERSKLGLSGSQSNIQIDHSNFRTHVQVDGETVMVMYCHMPPFLFVC